ncbi:hypothetical protein BCR33DRAFT_716082 [Rhizoclosmatium globosum]|uniref:Uncharacterized protein n=1 Tax=Rhizoclosmatium globosum TaxID=329046 RepID=A0A1Y2CGM8_9FUNG|nr:hypothetical protein BCR33DRAFT_716082 [Rhizoclosmatium globosum]|eukprot:ORY46076.1 hypothetical protein BCR33DRAFT_716082 [Rhizoclosmatium globosum]
MSWGGRAQRSSFLPSKYGVHHLDSPQKWVQQSFLLASAFLILFLLQQDDVTEPNRCVLLSCGENYKMVAAEAEAVEGEVEAIVEDETGLDGSQTARAQRFRNFLLVEE